jgi:5-methylcytosine-specific restriction endonuclease McrA
MESTKKKYQRPQVEVVCSNSLCGKSYTKDISEVKRNQKRGSYNYCSLSCSGKSNHDQLLKFSGNHKLLIPNNRNDKFTGLREHFRRVKLREKEVNITLDDLLEIWETQKGICPYTGLSLIHPKDSKNYSMLYKASLDRIDSSQGYTLTNVVTSCKICNRAKSDMPQKEFYDWIKRLNVKIISE